MWVDCSTIMWWQHTELLTGVNFFLNVFKHSINWKWLNSSSVNVFSNLSVFDLSTFGLILSSLFVDFLCQTLRSDLRVGQNDLRLDFRHHPKDSIFDISKLLTLLLLATSAYLFIYFRSDVDVHTLHTHLGSMNKQHQTYNLRRSTSCALAPGKVTVMVVGELMSYFLCGVRQTCSRTSSAYTTLANTATNGLMRDGKKLQRSKNKHC